MRAKFQMTLDRYDQMLEDQGNRCAICRCTPEQNGRRLSVDHDHVCCPGRKSCGECVRMLLCDHCNMGIGKFMDNPGLLRAAAEYLEQYVEGS